MYSLPSFPRLIQKRRIRSFVLLGLVTVFFRCLIADRIVDLKFANYPNGGTQCFPFYTYDEDGTNRQENITDWAWKQFQSHYQDSTISKWDIFHYIYGLLHHPDYRKRYQANLKRDLPRIPYAPDFQAFAKAGRQLAELHLHYENQREYPLDLIETPDTLVSWGVEKMRLSKDKNADSI